MDRPISFEFTRRNIGEGAYMAEFTIDPEFRDLLPPLSDDEFNGLRDMINKDGCRDPLVIWKEWHILIDGHNRYEICTSLSLPFETVEMSFHGREDVKIWMIRNQLKRRNLTDAMRVALNLKLKPVLAAKAKENIKGGDHGNQHTGGKEATLQNSVKLPDVVESLNTQQEIADASGVSHDTVYRVEQIMEKADEETKAKVLSGEMSINKGFQSVKPVKEKPEPEPELPPLTDKQEQGWVAMKDEIFGRIRQYVRRCPSARGMVKQDLKALLKSIQEG